MGSCPPSTVHHRLRPGCKPRPSPHTGQRVRTFVERSERQGCRRTASPATRRTCRGTATGSTFDHNRNGRLGDLDVYRSGRIWRCAPCGGPKSIVQAKIVMPDVPERVRRDVTRSVCSPFRRPEVENVPSLQSVDPRRSSRQRDRPADGSPSATKRNVGLARRGEVVRSAPRAGSGPGRSTRTSQPAAGAVQVMRSGCLGPHLEAPSCRLRGRRNRPTPSTPPIRARRPTAGDSRHSKAAPETGSRR